MGRGRARPGPAARRGLVDALGRARRRRGLRRARALDRERPRRLPDRRPLVPVASAPSAPASIAYFSPEFGITEVLPQYSGGLGILAGDHLKSASDLGVPIIGVGLLYRSGYFRQSLSPRRLAAGDLPRPRPRRAARSRCCASTTARRSWSRSACPAAARCARTCGGPTSAGSRCSCSTPTSRSNDPAERDVTDRLYGGGGEHRLQQEMLLGIGGVRALRAFSRITGAPEPEVFHTNEGHAGFLGLERIRELVVAEGLGLRRGAAGGPRRHRVHHPHAGARRASTASRASWSSSTSAATTPAAGVPVDAHPRARRRGLRGRRPDGLQHGRHGPAARPAGQRREPAARRGQPRDVRRACGRASTSTRCRSRSITNGVHAPTWVAPRDPRPARRAGRARAAPRRPRAGRSAARDPRRRALGHQARAARAARRGRPPPAAAVLGAARRVRRRARLGRRRPRPRRPHDRLRPSRAVLQAAHPDAARPERLTALLLHPERPMQLVIAGKSHPADDGGKQLIQQIVHFADDPEVRHRIVFLPDYDIGMARLLYPGCDVWLNNPLRPLEACGTSGMKAALNGGLNLSILDGWWDEWYDGENGWAIPTADGVADPDRRDDLEAAALYDLIEKSVAPRFYDVDAAGCRRAGSTMVRHTLATLGPEGAGQPDGARLRPRALRAGGDVVARGAGRRRRAGQGARGVRRPGPRGLAGVRVEHVDASGVGDAPERGHPADRARVRGARRRSPRTTSTSSSSTAGSTTTTGSSPDAVTRARRRPRATRATAGASRRRVSLRRHRPVRLHRARPARPRGPARPGRARAAGAAACRPPWRATSSPTFAPTY